MFTTSSESDKLEFPPLPEQSDDVSVSTVIGEATATTGSISTSAAIRVDGRITGDVHAHTVVISAGGTVKGTVQARRVVIQGALEGAIFAEQVSIEAQANVNGEVNFSKNLALARTACFEGHVRMTDNLSPPEVVTKAREIEDRPSHSASVAE